MMINILDDIFKGIFFQEKLNILMDLTEVKFELMYNDFHSRKYIWRCCLQNGNHFEEFPVVPKGS